MQKYKKKHGDKYVYDYVRACKNESILKQNQFCDKYGRMILAKLLNRLEPLIEKGYKPIYDPVNYPEGYVKLDDILGNIEGETGFNKLYDKIDDLILNGKTLDNHSRELIRKFQLKKEALLDLWNWKSKEFEGMTPEELKQLREVKNLIKEHQSLIEEKKDKKSQGKDITKEEYKRRFGYYPDLGKK